MAAAAAAAATSRTCVCRQLLPKSQGRQHGRKEDICGRWQDPAGKAGEHTHYVKAHGRGRAAAEARTHLVPQLSPWTQSSL